MASSVLLVVAALAPIGTVAADDPLDPVRLSTSPVMAFIDGPIWDLAPDGETVVYPTLEEELLAVPTAGGTATVLSPPTIAENILIYPTVSPDSQTVLYTVRSHTANQSSLYAVPIGGGDSVSFYPEIVHPDLGAETMVRGRFSPDSSRVVYTVTDGYRTTLHSAPASGGPTTDFDSGYCSDGFPFEISPDSRTVVLGCSTFLYSTPITGGPLQRLPTNRATNDVVSDSAYITLDSQTVLYLGDNGPGTPQSLYSVSIDGGLATQLSHNLGTEDVNDYLVSADESTIVYRSGHQMWAIPMQGGSPVAQTPDFQNHEETDVVGLSPDGAHLVYRIFHDAHYELYSADTDTGAIVHLNGNLDSGESVEIPQISPDSNHAIFRATVNGDYTLFSVPIGGGQNTNLSHGLDLGSRAGDAQVTPDSQRVVFVAQTTEHPYSSHVYSVPIGGGNPYLINPSTPSVDSEKGPRIAADSMHVVYVVDPSGPEADLYSSVITRPPAFGNQDLFVAEDATWGTEIGTVFVVEPDGDPLVYTTLSGDTHLFAVDPDTGIVTLTAGLDYETAASHALELDVSDGFFTETATITIRVENLNDNPPVGDDLAASIPEDAALGTTLGTIFGADADGDALTYALSEPNALFAIDGAGVVTLVGALDYDTASGHQFTATISDGVFTGSATVTITVVDVEETPPTTTTTTMPPPPPPPPPDFDDVPDTDLFLDDITWLATQGITRGCNPPTNDQYCPDTYVTRGQMAAFLHRALDGTITTGQPITFTDDDGSVFAPDIEWLAAVGVTTGCNPPANDRYCPNSYVTRGQMAAFLHRALDDTITTGPPVTFTDDDGSAFETDIEWLAATGVTKGCNPPDNTMFCPNANVTRGQMAAFLRRALDR